MSAILSQALANSMSLIVPAILASVVVSVLMVFFTRQPRTSASLVRNALLGVVMGAVYAVAYGVFCAIVGFTVSTEGAMAGLIAVVVTLSLLNSRRRSAA